MGDEKNDTTLEQLLMGIENDTTPFPFGGSLLDMKVPGSDTLTELENHIAQIIELCEKIQSNYGKLLIKADSLVTDLEHLITFANMSSNKGRDIQSYVTDGQLPSEVENVSPKDYNKVLADVLSVRRNIKDGVAVFKSLTTDLTYSHEHMTKMKNRIYKCGSIHILSDLEEKGDVDRKGKARTSSRPTGKNAGAPTGAKMKS